MKLTGFESNKINSDMVNHPSHYNLPDRKECTLYVWFKSTPHQSYVGLVRAVIS